MWYIYIMNGSLKIAAEVHRLAKVKAAEANMFLHELVEDAIRTYKPRRLATHTEKPRRAKRKAG